MNYKTEMTENNETIQSLLSTLQNLPNLADAQQGAYVWKKLTAEGGDFVDFVVNDTETAYPDGGMQDGYWYEKVVEGKIGIDYGSVTLGNTDNIKEFSFSHSLGKAVSRTIVFKDDITTPSQPGSERIILLIIDNDAIYRRGSYELSSLTVTVSKKETRFIVSWDSTLYKFYKYATYHWIAIA